ncbi:MAG: phosphatase [Peptococcaceae bacterium]|nr:phosphatase [Peptococcaceae bacterium]
MYSVIDIGSNTIRLTVYHVLENDEIQPIFHEKSVAGLAGYVTKDGRMSQEGIEKAAEVLNSFKEILRRLKLNHIHAFATASLRNIVNTQEALEKIRDLTGCSIQILSGKEEAVLDYVGATYLVPINRGLVLDIGGGSTELTFFNESGIEKALSLPIGSLNLYNKFVTRVFPNEEEKKALEKAVLKELRKKAVPKTLCPLICGVGGTVRATGRLANDRLKLPVTNKKLLPDTVNEILWSFDGTSKDSLRQVLRIMPERLHTIIPGMVILDCVCRQFGAKEIHISDYGVREGYLISEILGKTEK